MITQSKIGEFLEALCALGSRQGEGEIAARNMLEKLLRSAKIPFIVQEFNTAIPQEKKAELLVDGENIPCKACCFSSGVITEKGKIISSMISSQRTFYDANINFNPYASAISKANHYAAPALAIAAKDAVRVIAATELRAEVEVESLSFTSANILVGNTSNPAYILIAHYDSLGPGAVDNASGVCTLLSLIFSEVNLENVLLVFSGNEELSYDEPVYWGRGYRAFEESYSSQLQLAKEIYVVDSIGCGSVNIEQNPSLTKLAFPLKDIDVIKDKVFTVSSNYLDVMKNYHSDDDIPQKIILEDIEIAAGLLKERLK